MVRPDAVVALYIALLLTFWINYPLVAVVRVTDLVILGAATIWLLRGRLRVGVPGLLILCFFAIYFCSLIAGPLIYEKINILRIVFVYKYAVPFILLAIFLRHKIFAHQLDMLIRLNILIFLVLSVFVYVHIAVHLFTSISLPWRPSFPLTKLDEGESTDSHLYSAYLANGLVFLVLAQYYKLVRFRLVTILGITAVCVGALFLTGSRNGILSFAVTMVIFFVIATVARGSRGEAFIRPSHVLVGLCGSAALMSVLLFFADTIQLGETIDALILRIVEIDLNDHSFIARVDKLISAFTEVVDQGPVVIGIGMLAAEITWYDSSIASLLLVGGIFGLILFCVAIMVFVANLSRVARQNQRNGEFMMVVMLIINYVIANLITEFFLVTRSVVPFVVNLCLIVNLIYVPRMQLSQKAS